MRQLARRLSRVAYSSASPAEERRGGIDKAPRAGAAAAVPEGHVPVHVGEGSDGEAERFLVRAELLGRPALACRSKQRRIGRKLDDLGLFSGLTHETTQILPAGRAGFLHCL